MASRVKRDITRNFLIIFLVLLGFGVLILCVGFFYKREVPILLQEYRTKFAEQRTGPDNGYLLLSDAGNQLAKLGPFPKCPPPKDTAALLNAHNAQQGLTNPMVYTDHVAAYLDDGSFCANDDPQLAAYMQGIESALPKMAEALAKPFLADPVPAIAIEVEDNSLSPVLFYVMRNFSALALYRAVVTKDTAGALDVIHSLSLIADRMDQSAAFKMAFRGHHLERSYFTAGFGLSFWRIVPVVARMAVERDEPLDGLLDLTKDILEKPIDRLGVFRAYCMMLDDLMTTSEVPKGLDFDERMRLALIGRLAQRDARAVLKNENLVLDAVNGSPFEFESKVRDLGRRGLSPIPPFMMLRSAIHNRASEEIYAVNAALAVRLEAFKKEKGAYPEKLDELIPQYMTAIPNHPYSRQPIRYKRPETGYLLYNVGRDGQDGGGLAGADDICLNMQATPKK